MIEPFSDTLCGLIDGDPVDPARLTEALRSPEARDLLVDFARLRAAVAADDAVPSEAWRESTSSRLGASPRTAPARMMPTRAAAALAAAALILGLGVEHWWASRPDSPPRAERILKYDVAEWHVAGGAQ